MPEPQYKGDHAIWDGKRFALSCPWLPDNGLGAIPAFLLMPKAIRRKAWEGRTLIDPWKSEGGEEWKARQAALREAVLEKRREKNAKGLARLKRDHTGERYDRTLRRWVRI